MSLRFLPVWDGRGSENAARLCALACRARVGRFVTSNERTVDGELAASSPLSLDRRPFRLIGQGLRVFHERVRGRGSSGVPSSDMPLGVRGLPTRPGYNSVFSASSPESTRGRPLPTALGSRLVQADAMSMRGTTPNKPANKAKPALPWLVASVIEEDDRFANDEVTVIDVNAKASPATPIPNAATAVTTDR